MPNIKAFLLNITAKSWQVNLYRCLGNYYIPHLKLNSIQKILQN